MWLNSDGGTRLQKLPWPCHNHMPAFITVQPVVKLRVNDGRQLGASRAASTVLPQITRCRQQQPLAPTGLRAVDVEQATAATIDRVGYCRSCHVIDQIRKRRWQTMRDSVTTAYAIISEALWREVVVLAGRVHWLLPVAYNDNHKKTSTAKWKIQKQRHYHITSLTYFMQKIGWVTKKYSRPRQK